MSVATEAQAETIAFDVLPDIIRDKPSWPRQPTSRRRAFGMWVRNSAMTSATELPLSSQYSDTNDLHASRISSGSQPASAQRA